MDTAHEFEAPTQGIDPMQKLQELMLYVADAMKGQPRFGGTKLNKILFYSDFIHYLSYGQSITGQTYVKRDFGPVPKGGYAAERVLIASGAAKKEYRAFANGTQKRLVANRPANGSIFTSVQLGIVDSMIEEFASLSAKDTSDASHVHIGWKLAEYDDEIPYETALLCDEVAYPSDVHRGIELARERGWHASFVV